MNRIILMGRLVKGPDVRYTSTQKVVTSFTLAVERPFKQNGKNEADFINCQLWGKQAENFGNYFTKGQRALVEGRLQIRKYEAKDGSTKWLTEVICERFEFIESRNSAEQGAAAPAASCAAQAPAPASAMDSFGSTMSYSGDDFEIPF